MIRSGANLAVDLYTPSDETDEPLPSTPAERATDVTLSSKSKVSAYPPKPTPRVASPVAAPSKAATPAATAAADDAKKKADRDAQLEAKMSPEQLKTLMVCFCWCIYPFPVVIAAGFHIRCVP